MIAPYGSSGVFKWDAPMHGWLFKSAVLQFIAEGLFLVQRGWYGEGRVEGKETL